MANTHKPIFTPFFEELQGTRILLRGYHENDAPAFFDAVVESRDRLRLWDDWPDTCETFEIARAWLREDMARWLLREQFQVGIWDLALRNQERAADGTLRNMAIFALTPSDRS